MISSNLDLVDHHQVYFSDVITLRFSCVNAAIVNYKLSTKWSLNNNCNWNKCCARIVLFCSTSNFELALQNGTLSVFNANTGEYFYPEKLSKIFSHCIKRFFFLLVHTNLRSSPKNKNTREEFLFDLDYQPEAIAISKIKFDLNTVSNIDIKNYNFLHIFLQMCKWLS